MNYISLLRGINVGGKRKILMVDLKNLYSQLGFTNITTYIQSGNIVFNCIHKTTISEIESLIEAAILQTFGHDVPAIVRTKESFEDMLNNNPFQVESNNNHLYFTFLKTPPKQKHIKILEQHPVHPDKFSITNQHIFIHYQGKCSDSKFTNQLIEKKLQVVATTRNYNTVTKMIELASKLTNR